MLCFGLLVANGPNIDEKLRAARERREEQLKLLGMRASRGAADEPAGLMLDPSLLAVCPQPFGRRTGWSGSSGPGSTMSSS